LCVNLKRVKLIIENESNEIILINDFNTYMLPGGHVEENERLDDAIIREIKEELGVEISKKKRNPFLKIKYLKKDYPLENINTKYIGYYYQEKINIIPNISKQELSNEEQIGKFKIEFINKKNILKKLNKNLKTTNDKETVIDTIDAINEYLSNKK